MPEFGVTPNVGGGDFGGKEDALRAFSERLEVVEEDLKRTLQRRRRHAEIRREAKAAVESLTEQAHAADRTDPKRAKRCRAERAKKKAAFQEAGHGFEQENAKAVRLQAEQRQLRQDISVLIKHRKRARWGRMWGLMRSGFADPEATAVSTNTHISPVFIALGVTLALAGTFVAVGYTGRTAEPGTVRYRIADIIGFVTPITGEGADGIIHPSDTIAAVNAEIWGSQANRDLPAVERRAYQPLLQEIAGGNFSLQSAAARRLFASARGLTLPFDGNNWDVRFADIDGDGAEELLTPDEKGQRLLIYAPRPAGGFTFLEEVPLAPGTQQIETADFNQDGRTDVLATHWVRSSGNRVLLRTPDNSWETIVLEPPFNAWYAHIVDMNGDGRLDVVLAGADGASVCRGQADGGFARCEHVIRSGPAMRPAIGDFNADGVKDIAVISGVDREKIPESNSLTIAFMDSALRPVGALKTRTVAPPVDQIAAIDYDQGTGDDLVVSQYTKGGIAGPKFDRDIVILQNSGSGSFDQRTLRKGVDYAGLCVLNLDDDAYPDVVYGASAYLSEGERLSEQSKPQQFTGVSAWRYHVEAGTADKAGSLVGRVYNDSLLVIRMPDPR